MTELRRRKLGKDKHVQSKNHPHTLHLKEVAENRDRILWNVLSWLNLIFGIVLAFYIGFRYAKYTRDLHENDMWFSNIKVKRNPKRFSPFVSWPGTSSGLQDRTLAYNIDYIMLVLVSNEWVCENNSLVL